MRLGKFVDVFFSGYTGFAGAADYENEEFFKVPVKDRWPFRELDPIEEDFVYGVCEIINGNVESADFSEPSSPTRQSKKR